jgi:glycosyltransferase involved in cell wall biosynthesis
VRNGGRFLEDALASILAQTHADFELVVCDNHSTDETAEMLARMADRRLRVVRPPNPLPMSLSHRFAVEQTTAPLVAMMGANDVATPDRLAAQVAMLAADPRLVLVGCWCETIDDRGALVGALRYADRPERVRREVLRANPIVLPSMLFRRAAYDAVGGFRDDFGLAFDYDLVLRLLRVGDVANVPRDLLRFRYSRQGSSFRQIKDIQREGFRVRWHALRGGGYQAREYLSLLKPLAAMALPSAVLRAIAIQYMNLFHGRAAAETKAG